jgi:hypothetical protein
VLHERNARGLRLLETSDEQNENQHDEETSNANAKHRSFQAA